MVVRILCVCINTYKIWCEVIVANKTSWFKRQIDSVIVLGSQLFSCTVWKFGTRVKHFHVMCGFNLSTIRVSTVLQERFVEDLC